MVRINSVKLGAGLFVLWGLVHVIGGAMMLQRLAAEGGTSALALLGNGVPAADLPQNLTGVAVAALGLQAWDLVWFGVLVMIVAVTLNWKGSRAGFWICLGVASATDIAYLAAIVLPGYTEFPRGYFGPALWVLAAVFSVAGYPRMKPKAS